MSIVGRNPLPPPGKPIHYCPVCGRGSTAGPCTAREATRQAERDNEREAGG
jgi:hypothetical protein